MPSIFARVKASVFPVREPIFAAAPTQKPKALAGQFAVPLPVYSVGNEKPEFISEGEISLADEVTSAKKLSLFDKITRGAGSPIVFFVMLGAIGVWLVLRLIYGTSKLSCPTFWNSYTKCPYYQWILILIQYIEEKGETNNLIDDTWQIMIQNISSLQVYFTNILLIRQQQNANRSMITTLAEIQSRNVTCERLLGMIPDYQWMETHKDAPKQLMLNGRPIDDEVEELSFAVSDVKPTRFQYVWSKTCHAAAKGMGSLYAYVFYWICIFGWVGIGPMFQFSDTWQLWVNTGTAISLTITSMFLQNVQQQQEYILEKCLEYSLRIDAEIESRLRELTEDSKPNPIIEPPPPKPTNVEKGVDNFADVMGSGLGVALTMVVFIVWIAVRPVLEFGDDWWLIIGTFTGLVGFIDAFVLRNMYSREEKDAGKQFKVIADSDVRLLDRLNVPSPGCNVVVRLLALRIFVAIGDGCGSQWATVGAVLFVIGLLVTATIMLWSTVSCLCTIAIAIG